MLQSTLVEGNRQKCGYAAVADLATGQQQLLQTAVCLLDLYWHSVTLIVFTCPFSVNHIHCMLLLHSTCIRLRCMNMVQSMRNPCNK